MRSQAMADGIVSADGRRGAAIVILVSEPKPGSFHCEVGACGGAAYTDRGRDWVRYIAEHLKLSVRQVCADAALVLEIDINVQDGAS